MITRYLEYRLHDFLNIFMKQKKETPEEKRKRIRKKFWRGSLVLYIAKILRVPIAIHQDFYR